MHPRSMVSSGNDYNNYYQQEYYDQGKDWNFYPPWCAWWTRLFIRIIVCLWCFTQMKITFFLNLLHNLSITKIYVERVKTDYFYLSKRFVNSLLFVKLEYVQKKAIESLLSCKMKIHKQFHVYLIWSGVQNTQFSKVRQQVCLASFLL